MLVSKSIDKALTDTHTSSTNYDPATLGLEAYNIVRNYVINAIVLAKESFFWDRIKVDTVIGQTEYNIKQIASVPVLQIKKVNKLYVKYSVNDDYYTPVTLVGEDYLEKDPDYYSDTQSKTNPFFTIKDNSIFIYPAPTEIVTNGLKMTIIYQPAELTATTDNDDIVPEDKQYLYSLGIMEHIYKKQGKINESNDARNDFNAELLNVTKELKGRYNKPIKKRFKNLDSYR